MKISGWAARKAFIAVVPHLGAPTMKKSGFLIFYSPPPGLRQLSRTFLRIIAPEFAVVSHQVEQFLCIFRKFFARFAFPSVDSPCSDHVAMEIVLVPPTGIRGVEAPNFPYARNGTTYKAFDFVKHSLIRAEIFVSNLQAVYLSIDVLLHLEVSIEVLGNLPRSVSTKPSPLSALQPLVERDVDFSAWKDYEIFYNKLRGTFYKGEHKLFRKYLEENK